MESRSSRYESKEETTLNSTRLGRNKYLYDDINNKIGYDDISNLDTQTRIDLSELSTSSRENYLKTKDYKDILKTTVKETIEITNIDTIKEEEKEPKVYDINSILEQAKKNRKEPDELERKRKLRDNNLDDIDRYKNDQENKFATDVDEEEIKELINTITSKELIEQVNNAANEEKDADKKEENLFDDLMDTSTNMNIQDIVIEDIELTKEVERKDSDVLDTEKIENSFYTKSMDLSENDFDLNDDMEDDIDKKKLFLVTFCVVAILLGIGASVYYFLLKNHVI